MLIIVQISNVSIILIAPNCPIRGTHFLIMGALYVNNINTAVILLNYLAFYIFTCSKNMFNLDKNPILLTLSEEWVETEHS